MSGPPAHGDTPDPPGRAGPPADTPENLRPTLIWLVIGQVALHAAMAGQRMATPLHALDAGRSAWMVGLLLALFAAVPVLTAMPAGRLVDRRGYHRPQRLAARLVMVGTACALASSLVSGLPQLLLQCLGAGFSGTGAQLGLIVIQRTAGMLSQSPTERLRIFSWLGLAPSLANMVGPVIAGLAIDAGGFATAYGLMLCLPLVSLAVARHVPAELSLPTAQAPVAAAADAPTAGTWARLGELMALPGMRRLMLVNWLLSASWDVHSFAVPVLGHERGYSASTIGFVLGAFTAAITSVRFIVPFVAHRVSEIGVLTGAMVGAALVFAVYPLAPSPLAMGACAVGLGLALGGVQPMIMNVLHLLTPPHRQGEALAMRSMAMNLSSSLMPLAFGALGSALGAGLLFWSMGGLVGAGSFAARGLAPVLGSVRREADELPR